MDIKIPTLDDTIVSNKGRYYGAGDRTRTGTLSLAVDFESTTSTNSITPAYVTEVLYLIAFLIASVNFLRQVKKCYPKQGRCGMI